MKFASRLQRGHCGESRTQSLWRAENVPSSSSCPETFLSLGKGPGISWASVMCWAPTAALHALPWYTVSPALRPEPSPHSECESLRLRMACPRSPNAKRQIQDENTDWTSKSAPHVMPQPSRGSGHCSVLSLHKWPRRTASGARACAPLENYQIGLKGN